MERPIEASRPIGAAFAAARDVLLDDPDAVLSEAHSVAERRGTRFRIALSVDLGAGASVHQEVVLRLGWHRLQKQRSWCPYRGTPSAGSGCSQPSRGNWESRRKAQARACGSAGLIPSRSAWSDASATASSAGGWPGAPWKLSWIGSPSVSSPRSSGAASRRPGVSRQIPPRPPSGTTRRSTSADDAQRALSPSYAW
jgi:hypothetical protein